ncbi:MAG TPA: LamG-like jellyroll fold domain-containing protein [Bryobacteraceae bacterium]|nr:LamG-like jellyroll fold domain-containing protein [Bryobacteraceae bacterium]
MKFEFRWRFAIHAVVCLAPFVAKAGTFYVATNGSDGNVGTIQSPLQSIQAAVNLAQPGDTVIVRDGTYYSGGAQTCGDTCDTYHPVVAITTAGTSQAWITIKAENKWGAVLDSQLISDAYFDLQRGAAYIAIEDFDITGGYWAGINSNANAHDILIKGNHFHNIGNRHYDPQSVSYGIVGVFVGSEAHDHTLDGNVFNNIGRLPDDPANCYNHDHGIYLYGNNVTITNNVFYSLTAGWGVQIAPGVQNCTIVNNTFSGSNPQRDGQIELWGNHSSVTIANNIFYLPRNFALDGYQDSEAGAQIYNNMVFGPGTSVISFAGSGFSVFSNILNTNPGFVNPSANDYHLLPSSPAIGAGAVVSSLLNLILGLLNGVLDDFDGVPRVDADIGAYEYVSGALMNTSQPVMLQPPVAEWPLNEGSGLVANDSSGNGLNGTYFGVQWSTNAVGPVASFNGTGYVAVDETQLLEMTTDLTVAAWISPQAVPGVDPRIVSKNWSWDVKLNGAGLHPQFSGAGKYAMLDCSATPNQWQQVVFTFTNGTVKGYLNGQPMPMLANTFTGGETLALQQSGLYIGTDADQTSFSQGLIRDVRLYNRALSDTEVAILYAQTNQ